MLRIDDTDPCCNCYLRDKCAARRLACQAFSMYMAGESQRRWSAAPRAPTTAIFAALFDPLEQSPMQPRPVCVRDRDAPPRRIKESRRRGFFPPRA